MQVWMGHGGWGSAEQNTEMKVYSKDKVQEVVGNKDSTGS